jgi:hypothetical protein
VISTTVYSPANWEIFNVFNIDFSDIYVYLNPKESVVNQNDVVNVNNIGSIYYMLDSKHDQKYCMLPPATWELINRLNVTHNLVEQSPEHYAFKKSEAAKGFYKYLKDREKHHTPFSPEFMGYYDQIGNLMKILDLTNKKKLTDKLSSDYRNIKSLFKKTIYPMKPELVDTGKNEKINERMYKFVLSKLNNQRPGRFINNQVDAANFAITYTLTEIYADKSCRDRTFYRLVSHSKRPSKAFKDIKYPEMVPSSDKVKDVYVSCCPQLMSTLILIKSGQIDGIDSSDYDSLQSSLEKNIRCLERTKNQCYTFRHHRKFLNTTNLGNKTLSIEEALTPVCKHFSDLI